MRVLTEADSPEEIRRLAGGKGRGLHELTRAGSGFGEPGAGGARRAAPATSGFISPLATVLPLWGCPAAPTRPRRCAP